MMLVQKIERNDAELALLFVSWTDAEDDLE